MARRLIVFDLDGTLLGADNRLSAHSIEVLSKARHAGLTLVAASGRGYRAAEMVLAPTNAVEHVICSNGALLYHRPTRTISDRHPIGPALIRDLYHRVNDGLAGVRWAWETEKGVVPDDEFGALREELDELKASPPDLRLPLDDRPIEQRLEGFGPIVRALLAHCELARDQLLHRLKPCVPGELSASSSSAVFVEVTAPGVDKRTGLEAFCASEGYHRDQVIAFGDHLNDLSMLLWAGRGIAMADAHQEVLDQIPERTEAGHDDDGVARFIETLL
ncbi:MAG TPA: HAD family hydrolase [Acidimicrobiales bacterium]|jgi:hypothetical protein